MNAAALAHKILRHWADDDIGMAQQGKELEELLQTTWEQGQTDMTQKAIFEESQGHLVLVLKTTEFNVEILSPTETLPEKKENH